MLRFHSPGLLAGLYYVTKDDCAGMRNAMQISCCKSGLLTPWRQDGWYLLNMGFSWSDTG